MCCIIVCPPGIRPSLPVLQAVAAANPHGAGIAWRANGAVQVVKTNDVAQLHRLAEAADGDVVIHFRIASVGGVCDELRHPFPMTSGAELDPLLTAESVLFQNGTWSGWRDAVADAVADGHEPPAGPMSDSRAAAWLCHLKRGDHGWLSGTGWSKWVIFTANGMNLYGDWRQSLGMSFSNLHWCGADTSTPPHLQTCSKTKPTPKRQRAVPREKKKAGQLRLSFTPSREFRESAERIHARAQAVD